MHEGLKHKTARGIWWSSIERFSSQGVNFLLGILIARQLLPSDYGVIAILAIFFAIFNVFVDGGFSSALIRKIDRTESDNSTVFYFNIVVGFIATVIFFLSAPLIAAFFKLPILTPITRVLSFTVFIGSFGAIQQALLTARIDFKTQATVSLTTAIISGGLGLWGAYAGLGVWALVVQMMSTAALRPILLWIFVKWRPTMPFSKESFRSLFSFGSKLLASGLIDITYNNIYTFVIGKFFSAASLGDYSRASQFAQFPSSSITGIIQRVTFPVLSSIQDEDIRLADSYRKLLRMSAFIIFPMMIGLAAIANPLVITLLTEKWAGAIIFLQIICFSMMWYPIHAINLNLLQVKGHSNLFLRVEVIKKIIGVAILCITIPMGLITMCWGQVVASIICLIVNTHYTGKLIGIGFFKQMRDLMPCLLASLATGVIAYLSLSIFTSDVLKLISGIVVGGVAYIAIAYIFKFKEIAYLKGLIVKK